SIRNLTVDIPPAPPALKPPLKIDGWTMVGNGQVRTEPDGVLIGAHGSHEATLVSTSTANDVELEFMALVDRAAHFIAKVRIPRGTWCRIRLRWLDQCLQLYVNARRVARVADNLLQSGSSVISVT